MKSYRLDEVSLLRLDNLSAQLELTNTEVIEQLVNFGFDVLCDFMNETDAKHSSDRFVGNWLERYTFHNPTPKK